MTQNNAEKSGSAPSGVNAAADAARSMLREQLKAVPKLVARASRGDVVDGDHVHKMRVATRRAEAALHAAEAMISDESALSAVRSTLKRVRKAGSGVRRCDVELKALQHRLEECSDADVASAIAFVMGRVAGERVRAERSVRKLADRFSKKSYRRSIKRLAKSIEPESDQPGATDWAMRRIGAAFREVWTIGKDCGADPEQLHELRLALKRLRYQAELFEPVVHGSGWRGLIETLSECQDRLGRANDSAELTQRVRAILDEPAGAGLFEESLRRLADELERETQALWRSGRSCWDAQARGSVERLFANGSTGGEIGPMMDLDAAMDAAIMEAQRGLMNRGVGG